MQPADSNSRDEEPVFLESRALEPPKERTVRKLKSDVAPPAPAQRRRRLDLDLLTVLVALDDSHSVSAAALALGMTQPQVSVALGKLRKLFKDAVFVRTTRGMQPTPRTVELVKSAREVLARIDHDILADDCFDPATSQRPFVFGLSDACEVVVMPSVLQTLRNVAPNAPVRTTSVPLVDVANGLESGQIDLAIGYLPDLCRRNFFQQTLFTDGYVSLIRADHPITSAHLSLRQFLQLDHATVRAPIRHQELLDRHLARRRIHRRVGYVCPHVVSLPSIVAGSDMITTIPRRLATYFLALGTNLRTVELPFQLPKVEIRQYWHCKLQHDARSKWLRSLIASTFHDPDAQVA